MNVKQTTQRYLSSGAEVEDLQITRADGAYIFDARGRKYIDFVAGWCVGNLGWNVDGIKRGVRGRRPDYVYPELLYAPWAELAKLLASIAPGELQRSYRATGGTEAVEIAMQVAMASTGRRKFVSIEESYHGNSIGTLSIGASSAREKLQLLPNCKKIEPPLDEAAVDQVETLLKGRDVAAFIMEPIIMNLGVLEPDPEFMTGVQRLCRRYGTLLVMDEVATGFGRTGALFASEHYDLEPDVMCIGKAVTAGYAGLGATIVTDRVARKVGNKVSFWSTYGWHPLAVDMAIANIRHWKKNRVALLRNVNAMSAYLQTRLGEMDFKKPAQLCIKGLAIGVKVGSERYATQITDRCREGGLLISTQDEVLTLFPSLTIDQNVAKRAMNILAEAI
jgi:acetylornithine/succinyldiaminopimelate/putrescine aminotransferase